MQREPGRQVGTGQLLSPGPGNLEGLGQAAAEGPVSATSRHSRAEECGSANDR